MVVDPMCGSGTTIDVAKELNRNVAGFDINITRPDIIESDARKLPLENESTSSFNKGFSAILLFYVAFNYVFSGN